MTWLLLVVVVVLVLAHEVLAARPRRGWPRLARLLVFAAVLVAVGAFATRAALGRRAAALVASLQEAPAPAVAFDPQGDPLLRAQLAGQTPARPYPTGGTAADVEAWRAHVVETLQERIGYLPAAARAASFEVVGTEDVGEVRRTLIRFTSWDGTRVPAYVHEPRGGGSRSGLVVVPGHGAGIQGTAGIVDDYQHGAALALARAGHVTLTPELRGFGLLTPDGVARHRAVAAAAIEAGTFYKAVVVKDLAVAVTVLAQWPRVDPGRLGATGASLGGELAVLLGVLDSRVAAVASHSYGGAVGPETVEEGATDEARQTPHGCHTVPGVNELLWQEDWFRLLAPRPLLLVRGTGNTPRTTPRLVTAVRETYAAVGAPSAFTFVAADGEHEFFVAPATTFFETDRWPRP